MTPTSVTHTAVTPKAAADEAKVAAHAAHVEIAEAGIPDELDELRATMDAVWGSEVVPPRNVLRGMALGGAGLMLARRNTQAIGFALGWPGWHHGLHFHSHQVGVHPGERGTGVGLALKLAQRAQCLQHGITEMRWTFDPLLAANASFNLVRLGVRIVDFLPNCYGERRDAFNTGDVTDRVEVSWQLDHPVGGAWLPSTGRDVISVPGDYQRLRTTDITAADQLRRDIGAALADVFRSGRTIAGLTRLDDGVAYLIGAER